MSSYNTRLYHIWENMKARCNNSNRPEYKNYGGLGITVCDSWNRFDNFKSWALGSGYNESLTIDRIDNSLGYEPENCRWASRTIQNRNTRRLRSTNKSGYRGVQWCKRAEKWRSRIIVDRKDKHLGYYDCRLEASYAYDKYVVNNKLEHTRNWGQHGYK